MLYVIRVIYNSLLKTSGKFILIAFHLFLSEVENEAHSQRAKPRQRPQDLFWRWKLVKTQTVSTACPVDPKGALTPTLP